VQLDGVRDAISRYDLVRAATDLQPLLDTTRDYRALLYRATIYRLLGDYDAADALIEEGLTRTPDDPDFVAERAMVLYGQWDLDQALVLANDVIAQQPFHELALRARTMVLRLRERVEDAYKTIQPAVEKQSNNPVFLSEYAAVLKKRGGDAEEPWNALKSALALNPVCETALEIATLLFSDTYGKEVQVALDAAATLSPDNPLLPIQRARFHQAQQDYAKTMFWARKALQTTPLHFAAHLLHINTLRGTGKRAEARVALDAAVRMLPKNVRLRQMFAEERMKEGDFDAAHEALDAVPQTARETSEHLRLWIDLLRRKGDVHAAAVAAQGARRYDSDSVVLQRSIVSAFIAYGSLAQARDYIDASNLNVVSIWSTRILVRVLEGDLAGAKEIAKKAANEHPQSSSIASLRAWLTGSEGKFADAHQMLDALPATPPNEIVTVVRVELYLMQGRVAEAKKTAEYGRELFPDERNLFMDLAQAHFAAGEYAEALASLDEGIKCDRSLTIAWQMKSFVLFRMGRVLEASHTLEEATEICRNSVGLRAARGYLHVLSDSEPELALPDLRYAESQNSEFGVMAKMGLGAIAYRRRRYDEAEEWFSKVVALQPFSADASTSLAWTLAAAGGKKQIEKAEKLCLRVLESSRGNVRAIGCLAALAYQRGHRRKAEALLLSVIDPAKPDAETLTNLGATQAKLGKYDAAEKNLCAALAVDATHGRALVELSNLLRKVKREGEARPFANAAVDAHPRAAAPWRALAAAQLAEGDAASAQECLRQALARVDKTELRDIRIELARLLINSADAKTGEAKLREAVDLLDTALTEREGAEPYLLRGIAELKLELPSNARASFAMVKDGPTKTYATSLDRVAVEMKTTLNRIDPIAQQAIVILLAVQLFVVWATHLTGFIGETAFATLVPLTVGLMLLAMLLPRLTQFKLGTVVEGTMVIPPREVRAETLVGPAADIDMTPALDPVIGTLSYDV
jgi:tetratricopeptide (TPR) repeat protein